MLFYKGFRYSKEFQKILPASQKISGSLSAVWTIEPSRPDTHLSTVPSVRTTCHTVRSPDRPSIIRQDDVHFRPDLHCFEKLLFQLASVRTSQHPVRTPFSDRSTSDSFQVQFKGRLLQPSGRAHTLGKNRNSNVTVRTTVSLGPDARSTVKEIVDLTSTIRTTAYHGPNARIADMEIAC
jgi:hypothetical protein